MNRRVCLLFPSCVSWFGWLLAVWCALAAAPAGRAQEVNATNASAAAGLPATPLLVGPEPAEVPAGELLQAQAARRALELGMPTVAADLLRPLVTGEVAAARGGAGRNALVLALATALLETGDLAGVEAALAQFSGPPTPAYRLRAGLLAAMRRQLDEARAAAEGAQPDQVPADERGWAFFLQAMIAELGGDLGRAGTLYTQAEEAAVADMQRARFVLARLRVLLLLTTVTEQQLGTLRQNYEQYRGTAVGYGFARQYAVALERLGRRQEAVDILQVVLRGMPVTESATADDFRLLLGVIAGAERGPGRDALRDLVVRGSDRQKQRVALQLLARGSAAGEMRGVFRERLAGWVGAATPSPILADQLLVQAEFALGDRDYATAEAAANRLLQQFPASELKPHALGVLTTAAWMRARYRGAAVYAMQAREALPPGPQAQLARGQLGVLVAEAYFRAGDVGDYRNAADAYAAVLPERPAGVELGNLMFQRVLAEVRAGRLAEAQRAIDAMAGEPEFDVINRWQAEWNVARALLAAGEPQQALARIDRLLAGGGGAAAPGTPGAAAAGGGARVPPELFARMAWLQARLSFESGDYAAALARTETLRTQLAGAMGQALAPEALREKVRASVMLLSAEALLKLERPEEGLARLGELRTTYPRTDAAELSFITEASYHEDLNQLVEAQRLLTKLADEHKQSPWAPYALYQAALDAERRGEARYLEEAYRLLVRLVEDHRESDLVFYAWLKQGDLLRKLSKFPAAQQVYEMLANQFRDHADVLAAELALADTHSAQVANEPSHAESAAAIYERLQDLPNASIDLRAEAAFKLGHNLRQRGLGERARQVWWVAVERFLMDDAAAARLGARGRYWMGRTLLDVGDGLERAGRRDEARAAYDLLLQRGLPGRSSAQARLEHLAGGGG